MTQKPVFMEGVFTLRNVRAMGAAALIEILLASGIAGVLIWQRLQPPPALPLPPVHPVIPDAPPLIPPPSQVPVPDQPQVPHLSEVPSIPADIPGPTVQPVEPPLPPYIPRQTQPPAALLDQFGARMLQAIDAAKVYPKAEMFKGDTGEAVVSFDYADGVVSNVRVDKSSGFHELDEAAIQAVQKAALPPKPAELAGLTHFVFQLQFDLGR